jgi:hypothetical protein
LLFAAFMTGIWVTGMVSGPGPEPRWDDYLALTAICLPSVLLALWSTTRWFVDITDQGITVGHLRYSTAIPWPQVVGVTADYWGLRISNAEGQVVTARMFGRPKWRDFGITRLSTAENLAAHLTKLADEVVAAGVPREPRL